MAAQTELDQVGPFVALVVGDDGPQLSGEADAIELIGQTYGTGAEVVVVPARRLAPSFFDLSTRQAGGFFQKMQNYQLRLAIVGDIDEHVRASTALRDFVGETNRIGHHLFVPDRAALQAALEG